MWCLPKNTILTKAIAVAMAAGIALLILKRCLNLKEANCYL